MKTFLGILLIILGVVLGVWVGVFLMFIPGVVDVVEAVKADPVEGTRIAWGALKIIFASTFGALIFYVLAFVGGFFIWGDD